MRIVFLILATLLAAPTVLSIEPRRNEIESMSCQRLQVEPRIIGREEAPPHRFPYHVALQGQGGVVWYNGALITDSWVITTAVVANALPVKTAFAKLGAHEPNIAEVTQQRIEIDRTIIHEFYNRELQYVNNIALLHLKTEAQLDRFVSPVMLAPYNSPDFDGARLVFTGFGSNSYSNLTQSKYLRYSVVKGISNSVCKRLRTAVNDGNVCVDTTGGKGGCHYDNGGPLVDVNRGLLVGLILHDGYWSCRDSVRTDFFTRISYHNKWIIDNIEKYNNNVM